MGLFDRFKGKDDDVEKKRNQELDELEEILFEDTEYEDWAEARFEYVAFRTFEQKYTLRTPE